MAFRPSPGIDGSLSLQGASKPSPPIVTERDAVEAAPAADAELPRAPAPAELSPVAQAEAVQAVAVAPRRRAPIWAAAAVLVVGAAGAAFWFVRQQAPAPRPEPPTEAPKPVVSAAELTHKLNGLLQHAAAPSALIAMGSEALAAGHPAVAFRAFEAADPYTSPEAALQLARIYDPRLAEEGPRAAAPNAPRAITYYALWKNRSAAHTAELKALCAASASLVAANDRLAAACRD